ncbi:hypothetical protein F5Y14DRAFT_304695 [Nemania sp. NC0429]|nr:hypothetical protein F5Y14DRAFT_304695 [Nemania sp. NC0429]
MRQLLSYKSSPRASEAEAPMLGDRRRGFGLQSLASTTQHLVDPVTWSAGAALLFGALSYHLSSRSSELTSELLCWVLLPVVFRIARRHRNVDEHAQALPLVNELTVEPGTTATREPSSISLWIVAICIAACSVFRAERGLIILLPALVPLLTMGQRYMRPGLYPPAPSRMSPFLLSAVSLIGVILIAALAIAALSAYDPLGYLLSVVPVVALYVAFTLLTPHAGNTAQWLRGFDLAAAAWPLSFRVALIVAVVLGRESYAIGFPRTNAIQTLTLGSTKAFTWYFLSQLARNSSWLTASAASTFCVLATRNPFAQKTDARALMIVVASLISLGQTLYLLPKQAKSRAALWAFALIPLLPYFVDLATIRVAQSSALVHIDKHPVEVLIREANADFDLLLRNQSKTFPAAYAEYQRRNGFDPPHGFEEWYKFAQSYQSPLIDDFDIISNGIAPFLAMTGKEVLERMTQVYDQPDHELWSCVMSGQPVTTECSHHGRENDRNNADFFKRITGRIPSPLNLRFLLNHLDEPTLLIPPQSPQTDKPTITNMGGRRAWEVLTKYCSSRKGTSADRKAPIETYGLPFVTDRNTEVDLCEHAEYSEMHGFLSMPESLRLTEGWVPVLSTGAPSTMGDLLYPSSAYVEEDRFRYHEEQDMDWDKKENNLYWAGSTTGGHGRSAQWPSLHRQRFVELAQNLKPRLFSYLRERDGIISRVASSFLNGRLYDVAFANVLQCDAKACREQRQYFGTKPWAEGDRQFRSRLVFDTDGNGISGRYYKLLASKSAVLRQTLFREWHDERLVPWVHYVPVSQSMEELPELVFYLTSTASGQKRAKEIAEQGQRWYFQALREIDVVIYVYRLLLELARLQDPDRPAIEI